MNAATIEGESAVWRLVAAGAMQAGLQESDLPDPVAVVARTAEAIGNSPFPPLTIPDEHRPQEWSPLAAVRFRDDMRAIAAKHALHPAEMLAACGIAAGLAIAMTKDVLDPRIGSRLVLEMIVGVSRMAPIPSEEAFLKEMERG